MEAAEAPSQLRHPPCASGKSAGQYWHAMWIFSDTAPYLFSVTQRRRFLWGFCLLDFDSPSSLLGRFRAFKATTHALAATAGAFLFGSARLSAYCLRSNMTDKKAPTPLTKSNLSKVGQWLTNRVKRNICTCCDETSMVIWPYMVSLPLVSQSGESGQRFVLVIECRTCGCLRNFSAEKIGLAARGQTHAVAKHIH